MREWKVVLTPEFKQEFRNIYAYIAEVLLVPETAKKQVGRILEQVEKLNEMPHKFALVEKEPWRSRGLRKLLVDNYVVFYLPNEKTNEVVVFHVFYGGRKIVEYVDAETNTPTDEKCVRNKQYFEGIFANYSSRESSLKAKVIIDKKNTMIELYEYGFDEVTRDVTTTFSIIIYDANNEPHFTAGTLYQGSKRIILLDNLLVNMLQKDEEIHVFIAQENTTAIYYYFEIPASSFSSLYLQI